MTYQELLKYGESALMEERIPDYCADAWLLFQYVFRMNRLDYLMHLSGHADAGKEEQYRALIRKRQTHYPLQYITHEQNFMGLDFYVDENVLIPRQDTEVLVEHTLKFVRDDMRVLDMCTGSGCIIVSIAANRRLARAAGTDLSEAALRIAAQNAAANHVPDIEWIQSDLFADICGTFDVIVSNPPYIPSGEIETLMCEVKQYEPVMALDGSGDGLAFYRKIIAEAKEYLSENGMLFLEIGWNQAEDVSRLMETAGYTGITVQKDLAGLDRVVYAYRP
ncbi:MAG TPA: peptide chain release factor N(5)-glutamine methyltransferase [Candidatus Scybalocola faecipullorum]|nr:peptide chain release factor N(5)-glutamine methyltransferase [Candidatus Scybalocola faecipullorum]